MKRKRKKTPPVEYAGPKSPPVPPLRFHFAGVLSAVERRIMAREGNEKPRLVYSYIGKESTNDPLPANSKSENTAPVQRDTPNDGEGETDDLAEPKGNSRIALELKTGRTQIGKKC